MTHSTHKMGTNDIVASKASKASIADVLLIVGIIIAIASVIVPLAAAYGHLSLHNEVMLAIIFFGGQILGWGMAHYMVTR